MFHFLIKRTQRDNTERRQRDTAHTKTNISTARLSLFLLFALAFSCVPIAQVSELSLEGAPTGIVASGFQGTLELYLSDGSLAEGVKWSSTRPEVVSIDPNTGIYRALSGGTARIFYTYGTKTGSTTIDVTGVATPAVSVTINPASKPSGGININDTGTLTATVLPANHTDGNVVWTSSNSGFVSINAQTGVYTAVSMGTVTITAQIGSVSDTTEIQVLGGSGSNSAQSIVFNPQPLSSLTQGATGIFTVVVTPSTHTDGDVVWTSNSQGVLTITPTGPNTATYVASNPGTTTVTARVGATAIFVNSILITVNAPGTGLTPATGIAFVSPPTSLMSGGSGTLTVAVTPTGHTDGAVTWQSSPPGLLTLSSTGPNTASYSVTSTGTVTITARVGTTIQPAIHIVTITSSGGGSKPALGLTFAPQPPSTLTVGNTGTFSVNVIPSDHTDGAVTWQSSNPSVVSVTSAGFYTALTASTTPITITASVGGVTLNHIFTAINAAGGGGGVIPAQDVTFVAQPPASLTVGATGILSVFVTPANHTDGDVTWQSSNASVLSVASTGATTASYTAVSASTTAVTITVTVGGRFVASNPVTVTSGGGVTTPAQLILVSNSFPATLVGGATGTFSVVVTPAGHTDGNVVWLSNNPSALSVTSISGTDTASYVAGAAGGTATITMTAGAATASRTVTVSPSGGGTTPATNVLVSSSFPTTLTGGATGSFSVAILPADHTDGDVVWQSDNTGVLSVTSTGANTASYVAGAAGGTATITMTVGTASNTRTVTVSPSGGGGGGITLTLSPDIPATLSALIAQEVTVTASPTTPPGRPTIMSSNAAIVYAFDGNAPNTVQYYTQTAGTVTLTITWGTATLTKTLTVTP